jgi:hypothetical protein
MLTRRSDWIKGATHTVSFPWELMPLRMNESKNAKIGSRQRDMAKKFYEAGLLSRERLKAVLR